MAGKVFGVSIVRLNGVDYRTKPGSKFKPGGTNKTTQYASGTISGHSDEPMAGMISCKFEVMGDTDVEAIRNFEGTAEFVTDVGITYAMTNAYVTDSGEISDGGGGYEITVEGDPAEKV